MLTGRILFVTTRFSGASTIGTEAVGQTIISLDNTRDFVHDAGFIYLGTAVTPYTAVDRVNNTITLGSPLAAALDNGTLLMTYPYAVQRWALIAPTGNGSDPVDAIWAAIPHALAGFVTADGQRLQDDQERVKFEEQENHQFIVMDVIDRQPYLDPFVIPDGAITETNIQPGSITTPLLAANAVATQNLQAGSVKSANIDTDALNGKTITGALIRTASTGRRVEVNPDGLMQFDSDGSIVFKLGDTNQFTGEIDATGIIIRDSLQLFGRNNLFATGSKVTLKATTGSPSSTPTLSWDYEPGPSITYAGWSPTGVHSVNGVFHSATYTSLNYGLYRRADGKFWQFPNITLNGGTRSEFKPFDMIRIARADTGAERVVMMGEDPNHLDIGGWPEIWIRVYDDSSMNTSGTVAPILKYQAKVADFSWFRLWRLTRTVIGTTGRYYFGILKQEKDFYGGPSTLSWYEYAWQNSDNTMVAGTVANFGAVLSDADSIAGGMYGLRSGVRIDTTNGGGVNDGMLIVSTNLNNYVYNFAASAWETNSYFPTTWNAADLTWADGDPVAGTLSDYYAYNFSGNALAFKYANTHRRVSTNIWASYTWRGEASSGFQSTPSVRSSIPYRKNARLKVTMPGLPAPVAGVGQARNPAVDVYGWSYYIAHGVSNPATIHLGPNSPTMAPNTPLAINSITLSTFPTNTGTQPPASNNFPSSAPALIVSDNGYLQIDGDGDILARDVDVTGLLNGQTISDTGWITPTLVNFWAPSGGRTIRYRVRNGVVYVEGLAGTGASGSIVFTFPSQYWPGQTIEPVNDSARNIILDTAGDLRLYRVNATAALDFNFIPG